MIISSTYIPLFMEIKCLHMRKINNLNDNSISLLGKGSVELKDLVKSESTVSVAACK